MKISVKPGQDFCIFIFGVSEAPNSRWFEVVPFFGFVRHKILVDIIWCRFVVKINVKTGQDYRKFYFWCFCLVWVCEFQILAYCRTKS